MHSKSSITIRTAKQLNRSVILLFISIVAACAIVFYANAAQAQHMPSAPLANPRTTFTFVAPTVYSDVQGGASFALVPHQEAYHLGQDVFVELWFKTKRPETEDFFPSHGDLTYHILGPDGTALQKALKPRRFLHEVWYVSRGVGLLNGSSMRDDLATHYDFTATGPYTITATVKLAYPRGVSLTSPPIQIVVQN